MYLKIIHNRIILLTDYMSITQDYQKKKKVNFFSMRNNLFNVYINFKNRLKT